MKKVFIIFIIACTFLTSCERAESPPVAEESEQSSAKITAEAPSATPTAAVTEDAVKPLTLIPDDLTNEELQLAIYPDINETWRDVYAKLLHETDKTQFLLCDINQDGIPELLIGGTFNGTNKYAEFEVFAFKNHMAKCIGSVGTLSFSCFWQDDSGIYGYAYGAGSGGTYHYYMDNDVICYGDEILGYYFDDKGNQVEWFRDSDGNKIIVTAETEEEYESIWKSKLEVEVEYYDITDSNIEIVIYDGL